MQIAIVTVGSRGDVQPCVALGVGLARAGHKVKIVTLKNFERFVCEHGLDFAPVAGDALDMVTALLSGEQNLLQASRSFLKFLQPLVAQLKHDFCEGCQDADAVVVETFGLYASMVAEKMGVLCFRTTPFPFDVTRAFPASSLLPFGQPVRSNGALNLLTHLFEETFIHLLFLIPVRRWRRELGLPPIGIFEKPYETMYGRPVPALYPYSPAVLPKPPDWGDHLHVTGYWFLDEVGEAAPRPYSPPDDLIDFLEAGPPPIYVGFGSMAGKNFANVVEIVLQALAKAGQRGLLLSGWGGLSRADLPDTVFKIDSAPHDWLFPRMAAVVHHGGAGTTGAGLRAGIPSILTPMIADQFFWARRVVELGVGPEAIPFRKLTVERLAYAMRVAATHEPMRQRAAVLGECIRAEDGVGKAVRIIERYLGM